MPARSCAARPASRVRRLVSLEYWVVDPAERVGVVGTVIAIELRQVRFRSKAAGVHGCCERGAGEPLGRAQGHLSNLVPGGV